MLSAFLLAKGMLWILERKNKRDGSVSQLGSNPQPLGWETSMLLTGLTGPPRCENHPIGSITVRSYIKPPDH